MTNFGMFLTSCDLCGKTDIVELLKHFKIQRLMNLVIICEVVRWCDRGIYM